MRLRTKYLICAGVVVVASTALWFIPPVQYHFTEEGYIYYNINWIPLTVLSGFVIVLAVAFALWQTVRHYRNRQAVHVSS